MKDIKISISSELIIMKCMKINISIFFEQE